MYLRSNTLKNCGTRLHASFKGLVVLKIPFSQLFFLSLLLSFAFTSGAWARDVYVRLSDRPSVTITSDGSMTLTDARNMQLNLGRSAVLTRSGAYVTVGHNSFQLPVRITSTGLLGFNNRRYRGRFLLTRQFLINVVNVEDYVKGVLPVEGFPNWPMEYQKAQAIISRTFVLRHSVLGRASRGYDVSDTTSHQVYGGAGVETAKTNEAVRATAGEVLVYGGSLAFTPFHSYSGGHTANNAHVWGSQLSYLRGVREAMVTQSPHSSWTARVPASQVQSALSRMDINVGRVREIRVSEADAGGRAITLTFVGNNGTASARASRFRSNVDSSSLRSTLWTRDVPAAHASILTPPPQHSPPTPTPNVPMTAEQEMRLTRMTRDGVFTAAELMDMLMNPERRRGYLYVGVQRSEVEPRPAETPRMPQVNLPQIPPSANVSPLRPIEVIPEQNGYFVFYGRGWGHGVGMSQWGAMAKASAGWTAERILQHYFPGTTIKRFQ